jgi:hypothetical protein
LGGGGGGGDRFLFAGLKKLSFSKIAFIEDDILPFRLLCFHFFFCLSLHHDMVLVQLEKKTLSKTYLTNTFSQISFEGILFLF